jgi:hypothetical protein
VTDAFDGRFLHVYDFTTRRRTFKAYLKQRLNTVRACIARQRA